VVTDAAQHTVQRAFESLDALIVVDMFLTETAQLADVVLPTAAFAEKEGTFTSTERRVQRVRRVRRALDPPGAARADWQLLDALATRLGRPMGFTSAAQIFDEMAALTPLYAGMSHARLEHGHGLQWPCPEPTHPGTPVLHRERFVRGRARLIPVVDTLPAELPDAEYPLQLTTCRLHHQYGCGSMTRRAPLLERENPRGLLLDPPARRALARNRERGPGTRALPARRAGDAGDRVRSGAAGCGRDAVPLPRGTLERAHQRRPRPDLAHARARGLRGAGGAHLVTRTVLTDEPGIERLRASLARTRELYEVARAETGAAWQRSDASTPCDWEATLPLEGIKRFFFPQAETLLSWQGDVPCAEPPSSAPFALFGVRACDAAALAYQDRFFARDPHYAVRRQSALVIGVNCLAACAGGFCATVDAGPFAAAGFDLCLTRLAADAVAVVIATPAGAAALTDGVLDERRLGAGHEEALARAEASARASFAAEPALERAIARIAQHDRARPVADAEWQRLGPSCFACTGCTNLCPTCSCFTIEDEVRGDGVVRRRVWDSCLLEGFQREASGHDPAPRPGDRVRRFWTHKFGAAFTRDFGRFGCVGCGRCDVTCPGRIGARQVLTRLGGEP